MKTPHGIPMPRTGELRCGSCVILGGVSCGRPATWHIAWRLAPSGAYSLACDEHMAQAVATFDIVDRHPAQTNCDLPGTGWQVGEPSRCVPAPASYWSGQLADAVERVQDACIRLPPVHPGTVPEALAHSAGWNAAMDLIQGVLDRLYATGYRQHPDST